MGVPAKVPDHPIRASNGSLGIDFPFFVARQPYGFLYLFSITADLFGSTHGYDSVAAMA
ncbi:MAG: hypothetical protein OEX02_01795 [Cyclobacteriaceae bacterium]|nr:hypothetical protein [Cyclobacteriaceae bacterium]